jgi:Coenzyme PQQ synthesis protein D (PqqD)
LWLSLCVPANLSLQSRPDDAEHLDMKIHEHIRSNRNQDGSVVLDVLRGKMYGLNPVASQILQLLGQGLDETQIKSEISRRFSVDADIVDKDVHEFLSKLAELEVIASRDGAPLSKVNQAKSQ